MGKFMISEPNKNPTIVKAIRLRLFLVEKLERIAHEHNISVNRLITECIEYALNDLESDTEPKDNN